MSAIRSTAILASLSLLSLEALSANQPALGRYEFHRAQMGTQFRLVLYARNQRLAARAADAAFKCIERLDASMSDYRETSELMLLCKRAVNRRVRVSRDLFQILVVSQKLAARSGGAFDVTVGPLVKLWRKARRTGELPTSDQLSRARTLVGYAHLHLDSTTARVWLDRRGIQLDLGGIAKGYAADRAIEVLKSFGIDRALVAAGGDIVVSEAPPGTSGWTIAVTEPALEQSATTSQSPRAASRSIALRYAAISTSGDAEQFVEISGVRYSHIVDPRTGFAVTGRNSVTVVAPNGTMSDGLATAANVLGPERGLKLIEETKGTAALFITERGQQLERRESKRWVMLSSGRYADDSPSVFFGQSQRGLTCSRACLAFRAMG